MKAKQNNQINKERTHRTPNEIARQRGISINKVLAWIETGELRAVNMAAKANGQRPRWRISDEALAEFDTLRTPSPAPKPQRRQRSAVPQYV